MLTRGGPRPCAQRRHQSNWNIVTLPMGFLLPGRSPLLVGSAIHFSYRWGSTAWAHSKVIDGSFFHSCLTWNCGVSVPRNDRFIASCFVIVAIRNSITSSDFLRSQSIGLCTWVRKPFEGQMGFFFISWRWDPRPKGPRYYPGSVTYLKALR